MGKHTFLNRPAGEIIEIEMVYKFFRIQIFVLVFVIGLYAVRAFASSETRLPMGGEGVNTISGWVVSNVQYHLAQDPSKIAAIEFDLNGRAGVVKVNVRSSQPVFSDCKNITGTSWYCSISPEIEISNIDELRVIATGQ